MNRTEKNVVFSKEFRERGSVIPEWRIEWVNEWTSEQVNTIECLLYAIGSATCFWSSHDNLFCTLWPKPPVKPGLSPTSHVRTLRIQEMKWLAECRIRCGFHPSPLTATKCPITQQLPPYVAFWLMDKVIHTNSFLPCKLFYVYYIDWLKEKIVWNNTVLLNI